MSMMQSVEIPADRIGAVREMIPMGIEHYVVPKNGFIYLNVRTNDQSLIRRLIEGSRGPL